MGARTNARLRAAWSALLRERGLTERGLATELGLSPNTLVSIGRSVTGPTLATMLLLATRLGLPSLDALLGGLAEIRQGGETRHVYVAGPLGFSEPGRRYLNDVLLPGLQERGLVPLNPWEVGTQVLAPLLGHPRGTPDQIVRACTEVASENARMIQQAACVLADLDDCDLDSGTCAEVGFAFGMGRPIVGFRTDFRSAGDVPEAPINLQVRYFVEASGGRFLEYDPSTATPEAFLGQVLDLVSELAVQQHPYR